MDLHPKLAPVGVVYDEEVVMGTTKNGNKAKAKAKKKAAVRRPQQGAVAAKPRTSRRANPKAI